MKKNSQKKDYKKKKEKLERLLERMKNGEEVALLSLLRETYAFFCFYAYKLVPNDQEFEDIITDSLLKLWNEYRHSDLSPSHLLNILHLKIRDSSIYAYRNARKLVVMADHELDGATGVEAGAATFELINPYDKFREFNEVIDGMSKRCREVMMLYYREDKTVTEIVALLGISQGAVSTLKGRGDKKLRNKFGRLINVLDIELLFKALMLIGRIGRFMFY